jgi:hypothetical protein
VHAAPPEQQPVDRHSGAQRGICRSGLRVLEPERVVIDFGDGRVVEYSAADPVVSTPACAHPELATVLTANPVSDAHGLCRAQTMGCTHLDRAKFPGA